MPYLEALAVGLGLANIVLLVRRSVWNFAFGIAMVSLYAAIFFEQRLYALAGLQIFFIAANLYGWTLWLRAGGAEARVEVQWLGRLARLLWLSVTLVSTAVLATLLHDLTDETMAYPEAAIAAASLVAQILLSLRKIESWVLWIAIDLGSIALYSARDLHLTAGLYAAFLVLSVLGLREWIAAGRGAEGDGGSAA